MRAFDIAVELRKLCDSFDEETGEYPPEIADQIAGLQVSFDDKVKGLIAGIKENKADATAKREVAQPILDAARAAERRSERLKELLTIVLQIAGVHRQTTEFGDCWIHKNPPSMVPLVPPDELPVAFQRIKVEADIAEAKDFHKRMGVVPDGFKLEQSSSVRVR